MTEGRDRLTLDAVQALSGATVRLIRYDLAATDYLVRRDHPTLDLCVTPRPSGIRARFVDQWGAQRFEPLGDIVLIPPGRPLQVRCDGPGRQSAITCEFHGPVAETLFGAAFDWSDQRLAAGPDIASLTVRHLLRRLAHEARDPGLASGLLGDCIAGQLAVEVARYLDAVAETPASGGLAAWRLRLIDERLRQPGGPPALDELAALCRVSMRQLTRGFRASRGCSIGDHIAQHRIETAKRLLDGGGSIKAIALSIGFSSTSSFARAFQRATGLAPRHFRQRVTRAGG